MAPKQIVRALIDRVGGENARICRELEEDVGKGEFDTSGLRGNTGRVVEVVTVTRVRRYHAATLA